MPIFLYPSAINRSLLTFFNYTYYCNLDNRSPFLVKYHLLENGFIDRNYSWDDTKCSRYAFRYDSRDEICAWQLSSLTVAHNRMWSLVWVKSWGGLLSMINVSVNPSGNDIYQQVTQPWKWPRLLTTILLSVHSLTQSDGTGVCDLFSCQLSGGFIFKCLS